MNINVNSIKRLICFPLLFVMLSLTGQTNKEIQFAEYLYRNKYFKDATLVLKKINNQNSSGRLFQDSVSFLIGRAFYRIPNYDSAYRYFSLIMNESEFSNSSKFGLSWMDANTGNYEISKSGIIDIQSNQLRMEESKWYGLASVALLERDFDSYKKYSTEGKFKVLKSDFVRLEYNGNEIMNYKKKSPFLAGMFSAIIPGSGKFYAGKKYEAISTLLIVGTLGIFAYESYQHKGGKNFLTIMFGTAFLGFYIGNIWGSIFSVKRKNDEFNYEIDQKILTDYSRTVDYFIR